MALDFHPPVPNTKKSMGEVDDRRAEIAYLAKRDVMHKDADGQYLVVPATKTYDPPPRDL